MSSTTNVSSCLHHRRHTPTTTPPPPPPPTTPPPPPPPPPPIKKKKKKKKELSKSFSLSLQKKKKKNHPTTQPPTHTHAAPPPAAAAPQPAEEPEEIIVRAKPLVQYRVEVELARDEMIRVFNEANEGEDNDVRCRYEAPTGSHIPQRVCFSTSQDRASANGAREFLNAFHGQGKGRGGRRGRSAGHCGGPRRPRWPNSRKNGSASWIRISSSTPQC